MYLVSKWSCRSINHFLARSGGCAAASSRENNTLLVFPAWLHRLQLLKINSFSYAYCIVGTTTLDPIPCTMPVSGCRPFQIFIVPRHPPFTWNKLTRVAAYQSQQATFLFNMPTFSPRFFYFIFFSCCFCHRCSTYHRAHAAKRILPKVTCNEHKSHLM